MVDDKHRSTLNPHAVPVTMWRPPDRKNGKAYVSTYLLTCFSSVERCCISHNAWGACCGGNPYLHKSRRGGAHVPRVDIYISRYIL